MIEATREPGFFSVLCVKVPGAPDPAARFWRLFFGAGMASEAVRVIWFLIKGGAPDVGAFDIILGLALTAGLAGFLFTHTAWSRPLAAKGRFVFSQYGVSFARQNRTDEVAPDWKLGWDAISRVEFVSDNRGFVIRLETANETAGGPREILADQVRFENCPGEVKAAKVPDSVPRPFAARLIVRAIACFAPPQLLS